MNDMELYSSKIFENIKHIDDNGNEYWEARELQKVLEYKKWDKFLLLIDKAIDACKASNYNALDHFLQVGKMVAIGSGTLRQQKDYKLSRYACYLIVMNGDSRKEVIALGQTYFAIQTRKQELSELLMTEDEKRMYRRNLTRSGNKTLNQTAIKSGVRNLGEFHNAGYKGLYNGETANDIAKRKKLRYHEDILDNMSSEELVANLFRITQTEAKLKNDKIDNEYDANSIHYNIGKEVRETIKRIGGTMPEDLPKPIISIKELENKKDS